jgi:hypothetical protein
MKKESQLFIILRKGCRIRKSPSDLEQVKSKADDRQPLLTNFREAQGFRLTLHSSIKRLYLSGSVLVLFKSSATDHRQAQEDGPPV